MDQDATWYRATPRPRSHCVRLGPSSPLPERAQQPPTFRSMFIVAKRLDGSRCHLVQRYASAQATLCWMGTHSPLQKGHSGPHFSADVYCGQMAGCIRIPLRTEVGLGPGDIVLDGNPAPPHRKRHSLSSLFGRCLLRPNSRPSRQLLSSR